jgi:acyl-CoA reductase-like NAD-dependent aldehyde dehydrogenase
MRYIDKDLSSIQEIRNLLQNAKASFVQLEKLDQKDLDVCSENFIAALQGNIEDLAKKFAEESNYGLETDERLLCSEFLKQFKKTIQTKAYVGLIKGSADEGMLEIGVSLGVVAALLPTHPTLTLLVNLMLLAMKSGNALVLIPNKRYKTSNVQILKKLIHLAETSGFPEGSIAFVETVSNKAVKELLASPLASLIVNIGCPEYINDDFRTNTPLIYGGVASGPVFIEHTANIERAVKDVIFSRSFDNGIMPGAEQFLVTENAIATEVTGFMEKNGAYIMTSEDEQKLISFLNISKKNIVDNYIGKSAVWIAQKSGFQVPADTKVLVSLQKYMCGDGFFDHKLTCPIIAVYLEPDWTLACKKCMSFLAELKLGHTLTIHSGDWAVIKEFAMQKAVGRIVVNSPTVYAATGISSNFPLSMILGGRTTGRGQSAANITPKDWTYTRCVGFAMN